MTLLGQVQLTRPYYHGQACGQGHYPWDETLRVHDQPLTPAARAVVTLAGIHESFGKTAERLLHKLTGLRLSESTVERTTELAGTLLQDLQQQGIVFGETSPYDWHGDRHGVRCA